VLTHYPVCRFSCAVFNLLSCIYLQNRWSSCDGPMQAPYYTAGEPNQGDRERWHFGNLCRIMHSCMDSWMRMWKHLTGDSAVQLQQHQIVWGVGGGWLTGWVAGHRCSSIICSSKQQMAQADRVVVSPLRRPVRRSGWQLTTWSLSAIVVVASSAGLQHRVGHRPCHCQVEPACRHPAVLALPRCRRRGSPES
jgi:hypothetical protein